MRVSVVVPTRDRGAYVLEAVRSALESGVADEVIVADGGSTDGSLDRLRSLTGELQQVYQSLGATSQPPPGGAAGPAPGGGQDDDVIDAEFTSG